MANLNKNDGNGVFSEHFAFQSHALVNFVGGGGKTSLIQRLMEEYCDEGPVLSTTTTRIHPPDPSEGMVILSSDNLTLLKLMVDRIGRCCPSNAAKLTVTRHHISPTLLRGVPADFVNDFDRALFPIILNEADGAAGFSIKMPKKSEPVLMENADYLVPVIGMDCLYRRIGPEVVFRWKQFMECFPAREEAQMTPDLAAEILMHAEGVCRGWKAGTKIIPFINKVDGPSQDSAAIDLANSIMRNKSFPVERVVFGSVLKSRVSSIASPQTNGHSTNH
ncbi:MAG: putative selenium-dependent hydroxylase accessory protein YqeC [Acidobacteria bacterium]|nr:putative selenium-dependent hydroxylase accessory protein YqeC [Acidobacteriota bacterium]